MMSKSLSIIILITFICSFLYVKSECVCSEEELIKELLEDLEDNGKLDCLRDSLPDGKETDMEKAKRIAAEWNGDCSFESESEKFPWKTRLEKYYGLTKGLVNVEGEPVDDNFEDQADMCEIIRALVANNVFPSIGSDVTSISKDMVRFIDCPGEDGQTEVCAANPGSFADKFGWYIFLDGKSITFNGKPRYEMASDAI